MRGLVFQATGSNERGALDFQSSLPKPKLGDEQVLVQVHACAVNHADLRSRFGGVAGCTPRVTGIDVCGEVVGVGNGVEHWSEGDQVLVDPVISCGDCPDCISGQESDCPEYGLLGLSQDGGHAEMVAVPAQNLHRVPKGLSAVQAAAIPLAFTTAWRLLQSRARVTGEETVLIAGASGAVGCAAVQIAKLAGCRVFALTSSDWKARELKELGADRVFVSREPEDQADWQKQVLKATGRRGVDLIVDPVGPSLWTSFLEVLAPRGRLLSCGTLGGTRAELDLRVIQDREISILGVAPGGRKELSRVLALVSLGRFKVIVDRQLPLQRAAEAYDLLSSRGIFGKIVLTP
jgi:NADPH:quinone reductase-like Zn-dependent oxidoreductase